MRLVLLAALSFLSCTPPCQTFVSDGTGGKLRCNASDAGARIFLRPYSALDESFADGCTASFDGGELSFAVTVRSCPAGSSTGAGAAECVLPALPPGRYGAGQSEFVVPSDGGVATCVQTQP